MGLKGVDFSDFVKDIETGQKKAYENTKNTEDVKAGKCTPEDEQHEPAYVLYQAVCDTIKSVISSEELQGILINMIESQDKTDKAKRVKDFTELLSFVVAQCVWGSIATYDGLLKKELTNKFKEYGEVVLPVIQDNKTYHEVLNVFKTRLGIVEDKMRLYEAKMKT